MEAIFRKKVKISILMSTRKAMLSHDPCLTYSLKIGKSLGPGLVELKT
jgi:hypothetical protein